MSANGKDGGVDEKEFRQHLVQTTESLGVLRTRIAILEEWLPEVRDDIKAIRRCVRKLEKASERRPPPGGGWKYEVIRALAALLAGLTGGRLGNPG